MAIYETAPYEVLKKDGKYEIRSYEELITVAVEEKTLLQPMASDQFFNTSAEIMKAKKKYP